MGLLDDAIREHLDLKRRRGADPAEVERDEREALGPVRRAPEGSASEESTDRSASVAYDQEHEEESWSHDSPEAEPAAPSRRIDFEQDLMEPPDDRKLAGEEEPEFEPESDARTSDTRTPDAEPEAASRRHRSSGDETIEFDVEDTPGAEHDESTGERTDDDVLEETPEFLQDTPDHDRLWFEQRPPKDFDFDK
jgi:hypothetical protein